MSRLKVAIIEDSPMLMDMLCEILEDDLDVEIAVAASGQQMALDGMAQCHVDLAIIDLELDEGSGLGVIENLQNEPVKYGSPKKVVYSNYAVSSMSRRARALGVDQVYDKSFQLNDLLEFVKGEKDHA